MIGLGRLPVTRRRAAAEAPAVRGALL